MGRQRCSPPSKLHGSCAISQLADELDASADELLDLAKRHHVWARTQNTILRPAEADKLRDAYWVQVRRQQILDEWREKVRNDTVPGFLQGPVNHNAHEDATIFRNLGLPVPQQRELHRYPRPKRPKPIPLMGTAGEIQTRYPAMSAETVAEFARQWANAMIESGDVTKWLDAGLEPTEAALAARLAELHVKSEMLLAQVHGRTVLCRLRDDSAYPEDIARLLSNAGLL